MNKSCVVFCFAVLSLEEYERFVLYCGKLADGLFDDALLMHVY